MMSHAGPSAVRTASTNRTSVSASGQPILNFTAVKPAAALRRASATPSSALIIPRLSYAAIGRGSRAQQHAQRYVVRDRERVPRGHVDAGHRHAR